MLFLTSYTADLLDGKNGVLCGGEKKTVVEFSNQANCFYATHNFLLLSDLHSCIAFFFFF